MSRQNCRKSLRRNESGEHFWKEGRGLISGVSGKQITAYGRVKRRYGHERRHSVTLQISTATRLAECACCEVGGKM